MALTAVKTDMKIRNIHTAKELQAQTTSMSPLMPPPKVMISVYCRDRRDTNASTKLILRSIFTLRCRDFCDFEKFTADIIILYVV